MLDAIRRNAQGWGVKLLFGLIIIVFVFWGVGSFTGGRSDVVAYVNDVPITTDYYDKTFKALVDRMSAQVPNMTEEAIRSLGLRRQALDQAIDNTLLEIQADKLNIEVSRPEIIESVMKTPAFQDESGRFNTDLYQRVLAANHLTPGEFEAMVAEQLKNSKLLTYLTMTAGVDATSARRLFDNSNMKIDGKFILFPAVWYLEETKVSDEDISAYYDEHLEEYMNPAMVQIEYLPFTPAGLAKPDQITDAEVEAYYADNKDAFQSEEQVRASHILIKLPEDAKGEQVEEAKAKILKIRKEIEDGMPFAEAAKKYSEGPSAPQGGDLGYFGRGKMVKPFEDEVFSLKTGEVSEPIRTQFGLHLVMVEDHIKEGIKPLDDVADQIRQTLAEIRASDKLADLLDEAMARVSAGQSLQEVSDSLGVPLGRTDFFSQAEPPDYLYLQPQAIDQIFSMPLNAPADTPLAVETGYILATKIDEKPETPQPLEEVSEAIKKKLQDGQIFDLSKADAERILGELKAAETPEAKEEILKPFIEQNRYEDTGAFDRQGFIIALGRNPKMATEAFKAGTGEWLSDPFFSQRGYFILKPMEHIMPSDEEWQAQKDEFMANVTDSRGREVFSTVLAQLRSDAKVEVVNQEILK